MSDKISKLSDKTRSAFMHTPKEALQDSLEHIGKNGAFKEATKLIVLCLDDTSGNYNVNYVQAGMKASECVGLLEIAKTLFLTEMEYIPEA